MNFLILQTGLELCLAPVLPPEKVPSVCLPGQSPEDPASQRLLFPAGPGRARDGESRNTALCSREPSKQSQEGVLLFPR